MAASKLVSDIPGLLHGLASLLALVSAIALLPVVLFYSPDTEKSNSSLQHLYVVCLVSNAISTVSVICFYWKDVQNFQLSTTSMDKRGVTPDQVQSFNQGRTLSLLAQCTVPMLFAYKYIVTPAAIVPHETIQIPVVLAGCVIAAYGLFLSRFVLKSGPGMAFMYGLAEIVSWGLTLIANDPSIDSRYPKLWVHVLRRAVLHIAFLQWGFFWYYMHSKNLASVETCRKACKLYHAPLFLLMMVSMLFVVQPIRDLPYTMLPMGVPISQMFLVMMMATKKFGAGAVAKRD